MGCCCSDSSEREKTGEFTDLQDEAERTRAVEQTVTTAGNGGAGRTPSSGKLGRYETATTTAAAPAPAPPPDMAVTQELETLPDAEALPDPVWKPKAPHRSNIIEAMHRPKAIPEAVEGPALQPATSTQPETAPVCDARQRSPPAEDEADLCREEDDSEA
eukprot:GGOE01013658.1.p1 GENE.GGOE01013658.1~~GGOE01013658.1.p1  ORF type:complete len:160 (-),score=33.47 GGOE01013658.1:110-589(-)